MTGPLQLHLFKGKRQRGTRPPPAIEFRTHVALADTLRAGAAPNWIWTHFPAGEERPSFIDKKGRRRSPAAERLKRMGLQPGFFDFLLIDPGGRHYWLELKRGRAPLSDAQEGFLAALVERGVPHFVARSYQEAFDQLVQWGAIRVRLGV